MKNKMLLVIVVLLIPIAVISFKKKETNFIFPKNLQKEDVVYTVKLKLSETNEIIELPLEEYIIGVVAAEMPAAFSEEALKAQAIASRSYAMAMLLGQDSYELDDTVASQVYISIDKMKEKWGTDFEKYYQRVSTAVKTTENLVATYDNEIVKTYYFAMSNGYTEDASLVFNENKNYLSSVESTYDTEELNNFETETTFSKEEFCKLLNISSLIDIKIVERSSSNRVNTISINNQNYTGTNFRKLLKLRSTDFDISINNDSITITTRGYGHGVGMSQYGANGMAKNGSTYEEIIKHYYNGVEIKNILDV